MELDLDKAVVGEEEEEVELQDRLLLPVEYTIAIIDQELDFDSYFLGLMS